MIKFVSSLDVYRGAKLQAAKTAHILFDIELNWVCMIETSNSFFVASSLCQTSSTVTGGEEWWASLSATHDQMFSVADRSGDCAELGSNRIPCVSRKFKTRRAKSDLALF